MDCYFPEPEGIKPEQLVESSSRKKPKRKAKNMEEAGKVQQVLDFIDQLGLTDEESCRLRKNLSDRNHRAYTKAEKEGFKNLAEQRAKDVEEMLGMYKFYEAEMGKLQKENKEMMAMNKDIMARNKEMMAINKEMEAKCEELQKEIEGHRKLTADYHMLLDNLSSQKPGSNYMGAPAQAWEPTIANVAFGATAPAPMMIQGNEEFRGMPGFEMNGTLNNTMLLDRGASTSRATHGNQDNKVERLEQTVYDLQNQMSQLIVLVANRGT